ncbi:hypothetical protein TCAL_06521 [Tigriopus californicus]|uniref:Ionotropic glutamate receptor L-glutamate and glycine-binding domain-containing protein n=1 Tax=Tigriopus californicus TaxID=6832 RepID=A0A553NYD9_TIGCA|nr:hypothetical protein TCAL_06521 [Tigriopus californicus]
MTSGAQTLKTFTENFFPRDQECVWISIDTKDAIFESSLPLYVKQIHSMETLDEKLSKLDFGNRLQKCVILHCGRLLKTEETEHLVGITGKFWPFKLQLFVTGVVPLFKPMGSSPLLAQRWKVPAQALLLREETGQLLLFSSCPELDSPPMLAQIFSEDGASTVSLGAHQCQEIKLLEGKQLNVTSFGVTPFVIFNGRSVIGVDPQILTIIGEKFGFTYRITWGGDFGARNPKTGLWSGVTGQVATGAFQLGVGAIIATDSDRNTAVDFLQDIYPMEFFLIAPSPKRTAPYLNVLKPFDVPSWLLVLSSIVVVGVCCMGLVYFTSMFIPIKHGRELDISIIIAPLRSITSQDSGQRVTTLMEFSMALKVILGFWFWYALIVKTAFGGNLNSFLIAQDYERAVTEDRDGSYEILRGWLPPPKEKEMMETNAVLLFPKDPVIMLTETLESKYGPNPLRIEPTPKFTFSSSFMVNKQFAFKDDFNKALGRIVSMGLVEKYRKDFYPQRALLSEKTSAEFVELTVDHIFGPIFILGCGLGLALVAFLAETVRNPCQHPHT